MGGACADDAEATLNALVTGLGVCGVRHVVAAFGKPVNLLQCQGMWPYPAAYGVRHPRLGWPETELPCVPSSSVDPHRST